MTVSESNFAIDLDKESLSWSNRGMMHYDVTYDRRGPAGERVDADGRSAPRSATQPPVTAKEFIDKLRRQGYHVIRFGDDRNRGVVIIPWISMNDPNLSTLIEFGARARYYCRGDIAGDADRSDSAELGLLSCLTEEGRDRGTSHVAIWEAAAQPRDRLRTTKPNKPLKP